MIHEHDTGQTIIRAVLYLGVFALIGAGIFARYVGPAVAKLQTVRLWFLLGIGFVLAVGSTLYGVYHTTWMLGDTSLMWTYMSGSSQGKLLLIRLGLLVILLFFSFGWSRVGWVLYPPLVLSLLLTLTLTSHAGAKGGWPLVADYVHILLAALWAGSVGALALVWPGSRFETLRQALNRVSALGLVASIGVALAGLLLSVVQVGSLGNLISSRYGETLLLKLGLIAGIGVLAAVNRFWLVPKFQAKLTRGMPTVSLEALLMVGVLATTGALASTEPPPRAVANAVPSVVNIDEAVGTGRWIGQVVGQDGLVHLFLDLRDKEGNLLKKGPKINLRATKGTLQSIQQTIDPIDQSQYHTALEIPEPGVWTVIVQVPGKTISYTLNVPGLAK